MMNGKSNILNKSSFKAFGWNGLSMVGCTINISGSIKNNLVCDSKMNKSLLSFLKDKRESKLSKNISSVLLLLH